MGKKGRKGKKKTGGKGGQPKSKPDNDEASQVDFEEILSACWHCSKPFPEISQAMTCEACYTALYCSRECQVKDWRNHKTSCGTSGASTLQKAVADGDMELITKLSTPFPFGNDK